MKKNWIMRVSVMALSVLLISTVILCGTFAKYTTAVTVTGAAATVAKFAFSVNGADINADNQTATINLFDTNTFLDENATGQLVGDEDDVEVSEAGTGAQIAPGMGGSFDVVIVNNGDVTIEYAITFGTAANNNNIPLVFALSADATTWTDDIATLVNDLKGNLAFNDTAATGTITETVFWKWAFTGDDTDDTALGFAGNAVYNLPITVTVTQVN